MTCQCILKYHSVKILKPLTILCKVKITIRLISQMMIIYSNKLKRIKRNYKILCKSLHNLMFNLKILFNINSLNNYQMKKKVLHFKFKQSFKNRVLRSLSKKLMYNRINQLFRGKIWILQ